MRTRGHTGRPARMAIVEFSIEAGLMSLQIDADGYVLDTDDLALPGAVLSGSWPTDARSHSLEPLGGRELAVRNFPGLVVKELLELLGDHLVAPQRVLIPAVGERDDPAAEAQPLRRNALDHLIRHAGLLEEAHPGLLQLHGQAVPPVVHLTHTTDGTSGSRTRWPNSNMTPAALHGCSAGDAQGAPAVRPVLATPSDRRSRFPACRARPSGYRRRPNVIPR